MRRFVVLSFLAVPLFAFAQPAPAAAPKYVPFGKRLKDSVVFISLNCKTGQHTVGTFSGTGFFVTYPDQRLVAT